VEIPAKGCEIAAVEPALKSLDIEGQVVTLDALHTQVDTARYIVEEKHAHYLLTVKGNQPTLKADIDLLNLQATAAHFVTQEKAHGRLETRRIWSSTVLNGYLRFPHAAQVACVQREVLHISQNKTTLETVYLISSLTRAQASPEQLLELNRGHWGIEALHHVRDRAFDEDRCRARKGHAPRALACLRNFAISVLRLLNVRNIAAALRELAADASLVLKVLGV
jgi:predicted transposase YbfD/YdcC